MYVVTSVVLLVRCDNYTVGYIIYFKIGTFILSLRFFSITSSYPDGLATLSLFFFITLVWRPSNRLLIKKENIKQVVILQVVALVLYDAVVL